MSTEKKLPLYPDCPRPNSFEVGIEYQDFVCKRLMEDGLVLQNFGSKRWQIAVGENIQGWEIKYDGVFRRSGRLSIEVAEKSRASNEEWVPSGIYRNDNTWLYIQGDEQTIFVFGKKNLKRAYRMRRPDGSPRYERAESHGTVRKFYIPVRDAERGALRIFGAPASKINGQTFQF